MNVIGHSLLTYVFATVSNKAINLDSLLELSAEDLGLKGDLLPECSKNWPPGDHNTRVIFYRLPIEHDKATISNRKTEIKIEEKHRCCL